MAVKITDVPEVEQIEVDDALRLTEGTKVGFTVIVLVAIMVAHEPPVVVKVRTIAPDSDEPAV